MRNKDKWYRIKAYQYVDDYVMEACRNAGSTHFEAAVTNVEKMLREAGDRGAATQHAEGYARALKDVLAMKRITKGKVALLGVA